MSGRLLVGCFLLLVVWLPLPNGSNRYWSWALLELWVFALAAWWLVEFARGKCHRSPALRAAWPALVACALWLAYVWFQLLPLPVQILGVLSPTAAHWHAAAAWPVPVAFAPLTLDRAATLDGALKSTAYVAFFALGLAILDRRTRISLAAYALVASGFVQALLGAWAALAGDPGAVARGSFVNRNHFAGYLEMCLALGIGLLMGGLAGHDGERTWRQFFRDALAWIVSSRMQLRLALTVMVIALVLSRSRMGNTAFLSSLLVTGAIAFVLSGRVKKTLAWLLATLVMVDIIIIGAYFGVEKVVERIESTEVVEDRVPLALKAFGLWRENPVFGTGLGSFEMVFTPHKTDEMTMRADHAHNDYLEFGVETGIVGMALAGSLVLLSFVAALRAARVRRDPLMRGLAFGSIMGILSLMIHGTVDFNLQIPANAMTFMLVLALAWIARSHGRRGALAESRAPP